ncbi:MAG TPA: Uma2 family endonuclease [Isosphaeraceae bacterium]|jgi:Uma2 family endonuclease
MATDIGSDAQTPAMGLLERPPAIATLADLLERLGGIAPERIRFRPAPGTATETDVIGVREHDQRICELIDGVLVEKAMGFPESLLALALGGLLRGFVRPRNLGLVSGADGTMRLFPGLVRIPDVAFASWDRIPGRKMPIVPIPDMVPDLAVEVLSEGNTAAEMARKRREYFDAGVRLVWMIDPRTRTATVFTGPEQATMLDEAQTLDGGEVLPGFRLPLRELFAELDLHG